MPKFLTIRILSLLLIVGFVVPTGCQPNNSSERPQAPNPDVVSDSSSFENSTTNPASAIKQQSVEKPPEREKPPSEVEETVSQPQPQQSLDEMLLFFPTKHPHGNWSPLGLQFEDVWFKASDGTKLHGWYCPCDDPQAVVLFAHGNAGNLSHRAKRLSFLQQKMRVSVMIFDYRGYGQSEGVATVEGILQDARAASLFLAERAEVKESDLVLMGRSLGGAVMIQLATETQARGLVVESSFSSLKEIASGHFPKLAWLVPPEKLNSAGIIGQYQGEFLQSHGNADRTIPYALGQKLHAAANTPKQFVTIRNGDHNDPQSTQYYEQLRQLFESLPR